MEQKSYKEILDNLFDGVYLVDRTRRIRYWNRGAERLSGYSAAEVVGRCCADNILRHISLKGEQLCTGLCPLARTLRDGRRREDEVFLHHKNGHRVPVSVRISPLREESGRISGAVEIFSDATSRRRLRRELAELKELSLVDSLTGLGNRRSLQREFEHRLGELRRFAVPFGLLFLDIDRFKDVNDTYGHEAGDKVLTAVSKTLENSLRSMDALFRWGGEEFVAIIPRADKAALRSVAERLRRFVEITPIEFQGGTADITVSVGGDFANPDDTLDTLTARADALMYAAKSQGRNRVRLPPGPSPKDKA